MNIDNGHLKFIADIKKAGVPVGYHEVPEDLAEEAAVVLQGRDEAYIDLKSQSPLAVWAGNLRDKRDKKKAKRKAAKEARKRNRR